MKIAKPAIPFESKYIVVGKHRLHYFDEGEGATILIAHGIPEWNLLYADLVKELSKHYRCIIPDHLGFGLSDKDMSADLSIAAHAKRLEQFAITLNLKDIHLYVHDLGGPIGLGALTLNPNIFKSASISNSWCWSLEGTKDAKTLKMMHGSLGKWLYLNYGFSVKFMAKNGFADKAIFQKVKDTFLYPHQTKEDRYANYILMLEMLRSSTYFDNTLNELKQLNISLQLVWGMKDKFFGKEYLKRWQKEFPNAAFSDISEAGHFPQLEATELLAQHLAGFINGIGAKKRVA